MSTEEECYNDCGTVMVIRQVDTRFTYGNGPDAVELEARLPVLYCSQCDEEFLDERAERIQNEVVCKHLASCECGHHPRECSCLFTLKFRWSDNVLPDTDFTIADVTFKRKVSAVGYIPGTGTVVKVEMLQQGAYSASELLGKDLKEVRKMLAYDPTGSHPEMYFQVWGGRDYLSATDSWTVLV